MDYNTIEDENLIKLILYIYDMEDTELNRLLIKYCSQGVDLVKLGDICDITSGEVIKKDECIENGQYKVIGGGVKPLGYTNTSNRKSGCVTISNCGTAGYVDYQVDDFFLSSACCSIVPIIDVNMKFIYYTLKNKEKQLMNKTIGVGIKNFYPYMMKDIEIHLPPKIVQDKIVELLELFESECYSNEYGIRQEIEVNRELTSVVRDNILSLK